MAVAIWLNLIFLAVESLSSTCFTTSVFGWNEKDVDLFLECSSFVFELDPTSSVGIFWEIYVSILELLFEEDFQVSNLRYDFNIPNKLRNVISASIVW